MSELMYVYEDSEGLTGALPIKPTFATRVVKEVEMTSKQVMDVITGDKSFIEEILSDRQYNLDL